MSLGCISHAQESTIRKHQEAIDKSEADKKNKGKLLYLLQGLGISEEHIPRVTKKIDDLMAKKNSNGSGPDDENGSSISEFDLNAEAAKLDDFEELFRVQAPKSTNEGVQENDIKKNVANADFKIQRKLKNESKTPTNGLKVKVCGGLQDVPAAAETHRTCSVRANEDAEMKEENDADRAPATIAVEMPQQKPLNPLHQAALLRE